MKKIEANTLEEAYALACKTFDCSLTALDCEIIQYPSNGFIGLFAKSAIIVVAPKRDEKETLSSLEDTEEIKVEEIIEEELEKQTSVETIKECSESSSEQAVLNSFFDKNKSEIYTEVQRHTELTNNVALQEEIEYELKALISLSCFDIDIVEVDVIEDTAYIFIDGEDAALLIGKEGYRYNALSYLISNWLQNKHTLYIKLEIAQFLASQQEMIRSYMEPVIEHVEQEGWGRTRALDGILVQIALEQLREAFPNKYVAIKRTRNGDRYVLINEFNKR